MPKKVQRELGCDAASPSTGRAALMDARRPHLYKNLQGRQPLLFLITGVSFRALSLSNRGV
jgi:hypothetical protein